MRSLHRTIGRVGTVATLFAFPLVFQRLFTLESQNVNTIKPHQSATHPHCCNTCTYDYIHTIYTWIDKDKCCNWPHKWGRLQQSTGQLQHSLKLQIILRDSGFTRLTISIDNKERLKFSTFISNMRLFMAVLFNSGKLTSLLGKSDGLSYVSSSLFLRDKLHQLHIRHLFNTSNLCINGCYVK